MVPKRLTAWAVELIGQVASLHGTPRYHDVVQRAIGSLRDAWLSNTRRTVCWSQSVYGSWVPHSVWNQVVPDPECLSGYAVSVNVFWLKLNVDMHLSNNTWHIYLRHRYTGPGFLPDVRWIVREYHQRWDPDRRSAPARSWFSHIRCSGEPVPDPLLPPTLSEDDEPVEHALDSDEISEIGDPAHYAAIPRTPPRPPVFPRQPGPYHWIAFPAGPITISSPTGHSRVKMRLQEVDTRRYKDHWHLAEVRAVRATDVKQVEAMEAACAAAREARLAPLSRPAAGYVGGMAPPLSR
ncbi:hypothetical protein BCR44DRAFT_81598, partial [Catenaria anguillulae PL171]